MRLLSPSLQSAALLLAFAAPVLGADEELQKKILALNKLNGDDTIRDKTIELAKDKEGSTKLIKEAVEMAKLDSKQFKYNGALILAGVAFDLKDYDASMRFFQICDKQARDMKNGTKIAEAFEGQMLILRVQKKYDEAEQLCRKMLEIDNEEFEKRKLFIREEIVELKTRQGKIEEALSECDKLLEIVREEFDWYILRLKGFVMAEAGRTPEAIKLYTEVIERLEKNELLKPEETENWVERTRYQLSNLYVEVGEVDKSAEQLKTLLKKKPDEPGYNNDLGYIWADHNLNLDEAEKLIRKALAEDKKKREANAKLTAEQKAKDNAAYLDSLGWVLFKKKQYAEAKKPLLEAVKQADGQHLEIMDHLADVHMALGEKTEAIAVWKKALDQDASSRRDLKRRGEIIKKLKAAEGKDAPAKPAEKK